MRSETCEDEIEYCQKRIAEEEAVARKANSPEAGEMHAQLAMLYKVQLAVLKRAYQAGAALPGGSRDVPEDIQSAAMPLSTTTASSN